MKKYNLFKISLSAAVLATAILFTGCPGEAGKNEPPSKTNTHSIPKISFNLTNAEALGATITSSEDRAARAADDENKSASEALLQKILEDGTVEAAMGIEGGEVNTNWSNINYVIVPPENINSSDIYLLMKGYSTTEVTVVKKTSKQETSENDSTDDETVTDNSTDTETAEDEIAEYEDVIDESTEEEIITTNWTLSSLICIHEDNSYDDVLLESPYVENPNIFVEFKEYVQFLKDGSIVFVCRDGGGYEYHLKKWNPTTKQTTELFSIKDSEEGGSIQIHSFSISKNEDYIYVYIFKVEPDGTSFNYLKIIKLSDLDFEKEICNSFPGVKGWCYNSYDDCLYYSIADGTFKSDKTGASPSLVVSELYTYLIPQSTQKVWGHNGYSWTDYGLQNILSEKTEEGLLSEEISYTAPEHYYFWGDYIFANDTLYLWHKRDYDSIGGHKDAIIAVPLNDSNCEPKNLLDFNKDLQLHSWDVNENSLFISGFNYETKEPVNSKIDLKSDKQTTIQSDSAFGSIAAL